ncbi:hypothetical protein GCM10009733_006700 [Nonomuraea maheshkhaliensis]|uniref:Uncharacterized protein n=1 Tax=Nonomuraea maheshkhaliensis TaxID=419590 RepID=A0ABP4QJN3_9ACTN
MSLSDEQIDLLYRAYHGNLYVYPTSMTRPGGNIHSSDLVALSDRGLTVLGARHDKGRRVELTKRGATLFRQLQAAYPCATRPHACSM